jgi:periplasmic divalent cation tolerance protein
MGERMNECVVVLVTAPDADVAARIARTLVEEKLAACGNVLPQIRSIYRWEGNVEDAAEALLLLKTTRSRFKEVVDRVRQIHPYQVPEVVAVPIVAGLDAYLDWVVGSLY